MKNEVNSPRLPFWIPRSPLWRWVSVRIITLTIGTAIAVAFCMWLRFAIWNAIVTRDMPAQDRIELEHLVKDPHRDKHRFRQLIDRYYGVEYGYPEIENKDWEVLGILVIGTMPVIVLLGVWMSRPVVRQFSYVVRAAKEVARGNFSFRVQLVARAPEEFQELATDFNEMITKLERYEREIRDSSAILAHELRTPLNAAMGRLQGMIDGVFPSNPAQLQMVLLRLELLNRLVSDLHFLSLARAGQLQIVKESFQLNELIDERLSWVDAKIITHGMQVRKQVDPNLMVNADRSRLGQVFSILIDNVLRYAADGGHLDVSAFAAKGALTIEFSDRGSGIDPKNLSRMFDRFWRAEDSRGLHSGGSGLGLSIASAICVAHGGSIGALNRNGGGATIHITLPFA